MATTVLGVGTGIFIIVVVWVIALVFGVMLLMRASGPAKLGVVPVLLLALIITLVLVFFPRSPETTPPFKEVEIVDTLFIGRYVLLAGFGGCFSVWTVFLFILPLRQDGGMEGCRM
ncbi:hypothetical protein LDENG_00292580 [Lucifuga dentata]|nr:hypothetical protein LDENG_00292580 [Lucifuga dentata]